MKEAMLYKKLERERVSCFLCSRRCTIADGKRGFCGVRENRGGTLYSLVWGRPCSYAIDAIEKKPFYHFFPGTSAFSLATVGCNFRCLHCFTPETMVMTGEGPKAISEIFETGALERSEGITELRRIENLKVVTKDGALNNVVRASRHHYYGEVIEIKPLWGPPVICTPDHQIFTVSENGDRSKKKARDLKENDFVTLSLTPCGKNRIVLDAKEPLVKFSEKRMRQPRKFGEPELAEIRRMKNEGMTSQEIARHFESNPSYIRTLLSRLKHCQLPEDLSSRTNGLIEKEGLLRFGSGRQSIPRYIILDERFAKLLGYYCAEGSISESKTRPNSYTLRFSFGAHEAQHIGETVALLKKIFAVFPAIERNGTETNVRVCATAVALVFKGLCGTNSKTKRVPAQLYDSPAAIIDAFIEGYVNGDGWRGPELTSMNTVSRELAFGVHYLLLKRWRLPRMYLWKPSEQKMLCGRVVNQSQLYYVKYKETNLAETLSESENCAYSLAVPIREICRKDYAGDVYNLEVEGEHSYLANFISVGNCQNWGISQPREIYGENLAPEEVVRLAKGCEGMAYTYTEPTIFMEYALDIAKLARKEGMYNVFVTNGYMTPEAVGEMGQIDASRIDLKSMRERFYKEICGARLEPVLESIKLLHKKGHIELINLIIPGKNDSEEELGELARWVRDLDPDIPLHFTAYYPAHKLRAPSTPVKTIERAREIAIENGVHFVYAGNVPGHPGENTYCCNCGELLIKRAGFSVSDYGLGKDKRCPKCGTGIKIVDSL